MSASGGAAATATSAKLARAGALRGAAARRRRRATKGARRPAAHPSATASTATAAATAAATATTATAAAATATVTVTVTSSTKTAAAAAAAAAAASPSTAPGEWGVYGLLSATDGEGDQRSTPGEVIYSSCTSGLQLGRPSLPTARRAAPPHDYADRSIVTYSTPIKSRQSIARALRHPQGYLMPPAEKGRPAGSVVRQGWGRFARAVEQAYDNAPTVSIADYSEDREADYEELDPSQPVGSSPPRLGSSPPRLPPPRKFRQHPGSVYAVATALETSYATLSARHELYAAESSFDGRAPESGSPLGCLAGQEIGEISDVAAAPPATGATPPNEYVVGGSKEAVGGQPMYQTPESLALGGSGGATPPTEYVVVGESKEAMGGQPIYQTPESLALGNGADATPLTEYVVVGGSKEAMGGQPMYQTPESLALGNGADATPLTDYVVVGEQGGDG